MKQLILFLIISLFFLKTLTCQETPVKGRWVISGGVGAHFGLFFQGYGEGKDRKTPPAYGLSFDRRLSKVVEMGFQVGWSPAKIHLGEVARYQGPFPVDSLTIREDVTITGHRTVVGLRTLFHFTDNENTDVYTGFRVGFRQIKRRTNTGYYNYRGLSDVTDFHLNGIDKETSGFGVQIVLLGYRRFLNEHWGFGFETAVGGPYYVAAQVVCRMKS